LRAVVVHDLAGRRAPHSDREAYIDLPTPQRKPLGPPRDGKLRCRQCGQALVKIELTDDPTRNASSKPRNTDAGRLT